jgi:threonine dehydrogenase-like Zn-dependent dehydrogenase
MGPIGFAALIGARYLGWPVTMYGRDRPESFRARLVRDLGGEYLAADQAGDFEGRDAEADGFDLLLECTGSEDVIVRTAAALASCGVMVWLGSSRTPQPAHLNVAALIRHGLLRNHLYIGSVNAAPRDFYDALAWLVWLQRTQPRQVEQLITSRVSPSDSLWHYEHRQPQGIKTVLVYT